MLTHYYLVLPFYKPPSINQITIGFLFSDCIKRQNLAKNGLKKAMFKNVIKVKNVRNVIKV